MPRGKLLAWTVLAVGLVSCGPTGTPTERDAEVDARVVDVEVDADPKAQFEHPAEVLRVIDGDTIVVYFNGVSQKIRFKGVNAPEMEPTPEPCATEARDTTAYYAPLRSWIGLEFDDEPCASPDPPDGCRDIYGRLLAYIRTASGADLGAILLSSGLARVYEAADFSRKAEYEALQAEAQRSGLCIWSH